MKRATKNKVSPVPRDPEEQERIDARIMAAVGSGWSRDEDELDDDSDLEGEDRFAHLRAVEPDAEPASEEFKGISAFIAHGAAKPDELAASNKFDSNWPGDPPAESPTEQSEENPMAEKTCKRAGCGKKLRANNTKGVCASSCLSSDAPPAHRASKDQLAQAVMDRADVELAAERTKKKTKTPAPAPEGGVDEESAEETLKRFEKVTEAIGVDGQELLASLVREWMNNVREAFAQTSSQES